MDASMRVAKTGLDAQQTRMAVISNNLANVNTSALSAMGAFRRPALPKYSPGRRPDWGRYAGADGHDA